MTQLTKFDPGTVGGPQSGQNVVLILSLASRTRGEEIRRRCAEAAFKPGKCTACKQMKISSPI